MSKNWTFQKIIGLGLNFTYEFEVYYIFILEVLSQIVKASSGKKSPFLGIARCRQTASGGQEEQKEGENCSHFSAALCPTDPLLC